MDEESRRSPTKGSTVKRTLLVSTSLRRTNLEEPALGSVLVGDGADATQDGLIRLTIEDGKERRDALGLSGSGGIRTPVVVDVNTPSTMYVTTSRDGFFRSTDSGDTWQESNKGIVFKEAWSLEQHPTTGSLFLGTGPGSIFRSDDRGLSWQECDGLNALKSRKSWTFPGPPYTAHVKGLGLCESDPDLVWGAVEVGWLVRSKDGGQTWENIRNGESHDSHTVTVLPDDPMTIVSTSGEGVFRSEDGGDTFVEANVGVERRYMANIAVHKARPDVLFTAGAKGSPRGWDDIPEGADTWVYRSDDRGRTWERLTDGLPDPLRGGPRAVAIDPSDPNVVLIGLVDGTIWESRNGGNSFSLLAEGLPPVNGIATIAS
jgi:photosystem II stability/assembly factor-like uncharacterized protein